MALTEFEKQMLRAQIAGYEEAERDAARIRAQGPLPEPALALERSFELWSLNPSRIHAPRSLIEQAEIDDVRAIWARLYAVLGP